jgi:hypothetical protein
VTTNVQLYEALKPYVGQEAAGMIAEVVPPARDLATKHDIAELRAATAELRAATKQDIAELRGEIHAVEARMAHRLMSYFIPLWVMMGSMALAIVGLVATRA